MDKQGKVKLAPKTEIQKAEMLAVHKALKLLNAVLENEEGIRIRPAVIKRVKENWKS